MLAGYTQLRTENSEKSNKNEKNVNNSVFIMLAPISSTDV